MAITFRANKGQALTYNEMDTNFGSFFYSSSVSNGGNTLNLHYKDSSAVPINEATHQISLVTSLAGGPDNRIAFFSSSALTSREGFIVDNGKVGINVNESTDTPLTYQLEVSGSIRASQGVFANSDERLKDNINTIENALDKVGILRGVEFNWTGDFDTQIGVIAQEVKEVLPEVVEQDNIGHYQVNYSAIVPVLIEAIKELKNEIEELKNNK
jgi:hypothetical protein